MQRTFCFDHRTPSRTMAAGNSTFIQWKCIGCSWEEEEMVPESKKQEADALEEQYSVKETVSISSELEDGKNTALAVFALDET